MTATAPTEHRPCTVLICDDQPHVREALHDALSGHPRLMVVGEADDADSCLARVQSTAPDVLILDVGMPGGGPDLARAVKDAHPSTYVLVYSARHGAQTRAAMLAAGADDYLVKTGRLRPIMEALARVCDG